MGKEGVIAIIQARTGSSRLPGKVLLPLGDRKEIEHVLNRVAQSKKIDKVILATTDKKEDDVLADICKNSNIECFRGSENDVLDRYYQAAKKYDYRHIVRVTGDCPLIDPEIIDQVVDLYMKSTADYCTNVIPPTYPDGLDTEIFSFKALYKAWRETDKNSQREHVTIYMWQNLQIFKQVHLNNKINLSDRRWVLDDPDDYRFMQEVFNGLYPVKKDFRMNDLLEFFKKNPEIEKINNHIKRNEGLAKSLNDD